MEITRSKSSETGSFFFKSLIALLFFASVIVAQSAFAQRVQPMVYELDATGSGASTSLRVENTKSVPMTLEFVASKIQLDEFGGETSELAEDDFLIFPPQALIKPGKAQVIRVKYIGDPQIETSQAYRISVKQLPVNLDKSGATGVAMLVNFHTLANVVPKSSEAALSVTNIVAADSNMWSITVENKGNRYARLSKTRWLVQNTQGGGKPLTLKSSEIGAMTELNLVLPNSKLTQLIPAIEGFDPSNTRIIIDAS